MALHSKLSVFKAEVTWAEKPWAVLMQGYDPEEHEKDNNDQIVVTAGFKTKEDACAFVEEFKQLEQKYECGLIAALEGWIHDSKIENV